MKQDLTLNVGTKYDGEGMKKLNNAVKSTAKNVGNASRVMGSLSSELNQVAGKAGQAAGAIGGLFSAFAQGGMVAGVIAAITTGITMIVSAFKKAKEEAKNAAVAMADYFNQAFNKVSKRIQDIKDEAGFSAKQRKVEEDEQARKKVLESREQTNTIRNVSLEAQERANAKYDKTVEEAREALGSAFGKKLNDDELVDVKSKLVESLEEQYKQIKDGIKEGKSTKSYEKKYNEDLKKLDAVVQYEAKVRKAEVEKQYDLAVAAADEKYDLQMKSANDNLQSGSTGDKKVVADFKAMNKEYEKLGNEVEKQKGIVA